jgi:DNA phosphorothioation-associated putative methyltransferase
MRNSVGKLTPSALYVHRDAINQMPVVLRLYEHCASVAAGRPAAFDIVKLAHEGRGVSWLGYPDFDWDPHPRTAWSYQVDLRTLDTSFTSYEGRVNRPLLHRKEEFLHPDDPRVPKFSRLTAAERRAGLYRNPQLIGTEDGWQGELDRCGVALRGHRLIRVRHD